MNTDLKSTYRNIDIVRCTSVGDSIDVCAVGEEDLDDPMSVPACGGMQGRPSVVRAGREKGTLSEEEGHGLGLVGVGCPVQSPVPLTVLRREETRVLEAETRQRLSVPLLGRLQELDQLSIPLTCHTPHKETLEPLTILALSILGGGL